MNPVKSPSQIRRAEETPETDRCSSRGFPFLALALDLALVCETHGKKARYPSYLLSYDYPPSYDYPRHVAVVVVVVVVVGGMVVVEKSSTSFPALGLALDLKRKDEMDTTSAVAVDVVGAAVAAGIVVVAAGTVVVGTAKQTQIIPTAAVVAAGIVVVVVVVAAVVVFSPLG